MSFEWDETKNELNIQKHGIDFETAQSIFKGPLIQSEDRRKDYGESRMGALGSVNGVVIFVVYTWRNGVRRLISARAANHKERMLYHAKTEG